jgi:hypothetical protein
MNGLRVVAARGQIKRLGLHVENLWMDGEYPVDKLTDEIFPPTA